MLNTARPLSRSALGATTVRSSIMRPKGSRTKRNAIATLMLTSLVDAFSILVIFLILSHSANNEVVDVGNQITLPKANESQLIDQGVVVRIEKGHFIIENNEIQLGELMAHLKTLNSSVDAAKREGLVIVADRDMDYEDLSPVILAGSQAGFTKFKFAVVRKE